MEVEIS